MNVCVINVIDDNFYNFVIDLLKIINFDSDIFGLLQDVLEDGLVKIKYVMFILMESMCEELFLIQ